MTTTAPPPVAEEEESAGPLTPAQWAEAVALWELGEVTLKDLSEKFGISEPSLSKGFKKRAVTKGSKAGVIAAAAAAAAVAGATERARSFSEQRQVRIERTKEQHYDWAEKLAQLTMLEVARAQREGRAIATANPNLAALRQAAKTLEILRNERWTTLGIDQEVDATALPDLTIRDLTQREIDELTGASTGDELDDVELDLPDPADADVVVEEEPEPKA